MNQIQAHLSWDSFALSTNTYSQVPCSNSVLRYYFHMYCVRINACHNLHMVPNLASLLKQTLQYRKI